MFEGIFCNLAKNMKTKKSLITGYSLIIGVPIDFCKKIIKKQKLMKQNLLKSQITQYIIFFAVFAKKRVYSSFSVAKVQKAKFYKLSYF
jgi:hypothetical protein